MKQEEIMKKNLTRTIIVLFIAINLFTYFIPCNSNASNQELFLTATSKNELFMPNLYNMRLTDAIEILQSFKFNNIEYTSTDGSKILINHNWKVVKQNILYGRRCKYSVPIILECEKIKWGDKEVRTNSLANQYNFTKCYYKSDRVGPWRGAKTTVEKYYFFDYENNISVFVVVKHKYPITYDYSVSHNIPKKLEDYREKELDFSTLLVLSKCGFLDKYPMPIMVK